MLFRWWYNREARTSGSFLKDNGVMAWNATENADVRLWFFCVYVAAVTFRGFLLDTFVCFWRNGLQWARASSFLMFLDHTQRRTTVGRTFLDEWLARRRDLYLITHNTHNRQTSTPPVGFEPTISAVGRLQNYALDRAAMGSAPTWYIRNKIQKP